MEEDTSKIITLTGINAKNDNLTFTVVTPPGHGTFDGTTYTPDVNYFGIDSFTFKANNGKVDSMPATVNILINKKAEVINGYTLPPEPDESFQLLNAA